MVDRLRRISVASALLLPLVGFAQNLMPPTDIDLKTSYCWGVRESQIADLQSEATPGEWKEQRQQSITSAQNDLSRLKLYLVPKLMHLDMTGVLAAKNQGIIDYRSYGQQVGACQQWCRSVLPKEQQQDTEKANICMGQCVVQQPSTAHVMACTPINWLPY